eukprot:TRINITY_DN4726_c0_g1_i2.p1 TRINITY_DN4726_c0_g1~~TRINITY_DN4726_c0_g1_i2.p1  ORF type:complete len:208 (-),score=91.87 TRINITY_DN4726_c0_g1_i2:62-685(-)
MSLNNLPNLIELNDPQFKELHIGPTSESNWLIPQKLLMSAYPSSLIIEEAKKKIENLLDIGINCFVCLQTEEELARFNPYKPFIEQYLKEKNLSFDSIEFLNLQIADCYITTDELLIDFIHNQLIPRFLNNNNCKMLIHCWGGHGRTGTVSACLISYLYQLSSTQVLERVAKAHSCRQKPKGKAPSTHHQINQVKRLAFGSTVNQPQ